MTSHDSGYRPPLPPRTPRPAPAATPEPAYSPFPTPALGSEYGWPSPSVPAATPPPLPRRPVGAPPGTNPSIYGDSRSSLPYLATPGHGPGYASFPPPPFSPSRPQASQQHQKPPPLPPRSPLQVSSQPVPGSYTPGQGMTTPTSGPVTPNHFTSFPPPPPGQPPQRVSSTGSIINHGNGGFRSKFPLPPDPPLDPEIPSSPPPAYSLLAENGGSVQSPGAESLPHAAYSSSEPPMTPSAESGLTSPDPSTYMTFPMMESSPLRSPSPAIVPQFVLRPPGSAQSTSPTISPPGSNPVSNPQSPDAMSFFPTPPLVSPMPIKDPIDELMQSVNHDLTLTPKDSRQQSRLGEQLQTPPSSTENLTAEPVVAPLRPPKKPLDNSSATASQVNGGRNVQATRAPAMAKQGSTSRPKMGSRSWTSKAVATSCVDTPTTFSMSWYSHPSTPDFLICSRCYTDHISTTKFANVFQSSAPSDGKPRVCGFSKPRFQDQMFPTAVTTSYLQPLIDYMRRRSSISDCHGSNGVSGSTALAANIKWYSTKDNTIQGFLACEACYEDYVKCHPSLSSFFQEHPQVQGSKEVWACDFALSFIQRQYEADSKNASPELGWDNFTTEAKARVGIPHCGQAQSVRSFGKKWFQPASGPKDLVVCAACYCDEVIHTGEELRWTIAPGLTEASETKIRCALGGRFNLKIAMARAHQAKDFSYFWVAAQRLGSHPPCEDMGVVNAEWWTLPGDPQGFQVCGACYAVICESLDVAHVFETKPERSSANLRCCFNITHPRLRNYMPRLLELYFTQNPTALIEYAEVYASVPTCSRDSPREGGNWYGWDDCHICAECYQDFARHHDIAQHMQLDNTIVQESAFCEMYSTRMRQLYVVCSRRFPPDVGELLQSCRRRREVYAETVPQMKRILHEQKLALGQPKTPGSVQGSHGLVRAFKTLEQQWRTAE